MQAYLEKRSIQKNMKRFYAFHITPTLFGQWALIRNWGRIGKPGVQTQDWFSSQGEANQAAALLLEQKLKKGYKQRRN